MTGPARQDLAENDQLEPGGGRDGTSSRAPVLVASTRAWTGTMIAGMDPEPSELSNTRRSRPSACAD